MIALHAHMFQVVPVTLQPLLILGNRVWVHVYVLDNRKEIRAFLPDIAHFGAVIRQNRFLHTRASHRVFVDLAAELMR